MEARPYDVAFPLLGMNPSGGVRMIVHVANTLASRGLAVVVSVPEHAVAPPIPLRDDIAVVVRRSGRGLRDRAAFVSHLPEARVYVATGYQTPLLIQASPRVRRARMVYLIQNDEPTSHVIFGAQPAWAKPFLRAWARLGLRVPATRIAVSRFVAERAGAGGIHRVIPPGIEPTFVEMAARGDDGVRSRRRARDARIAVGTLVHPGRIKGMQIAFDAFARVRSDAPIRFFAFDGANPAPIPPSVEPFSRVAGEQGIAHDIASFLSYVDVFVFPSRVEGFGLPPLEAMACGAAVVVTDSGGVREYARDEENCLLVPPGDATAIARAIERLSIDPGAETLRERLARAGRATALAYPVERFANACADEIERVLTPRNRS